MNILRNLIFITASGLMSSAFMRNFSKSMRSAELKKNNVGGNRRFTDQ